MIRRVLLPLLAPAIFASAVLVFSGVIDDFVIVDLLSSSAGNTRCRWSSTRRSTAGMAAQR